MKVYVRLVLILGIWTSAKAQHENQKYLNQKPPTNTPQIFAPNLISTTDGYEFGSVFNKDATEFYYGVAVNGKEEIHYSELVNSKWTQPVTIFKHAKYGYNDPFLSNDENRLYFISKQALDGKGEPKDYDIWYAERNQTGWSQPINAGTNINTTSDEYYISFTNTDTMYFASSKTDNNFDVYASKVKDGKFQKPEPLSAAINTEHYEADVFIAPDESYIVFCAKRPEGLGRGDLYISFKNPDGTWTNSVNLGNTINTKGHELCPFVSKDGKYLFYTSNKDIYWVSTDIFQNYK